MNGAIRDKLKWAMCDPERLRPGETRQTLTERAARHFARLAQSLREQGHGPEDVAHFVNRLVFCMFAEDVGLLLSPRVRGSLWSDGAARGWGGSIPACAGKPMSRLLHWKLMAVYPRVCGEAVRTRFGDWFCWGLSPRVRGSRDRGGPVESPGGSIPACAGKPETGLPGAPSRRVYPRVCGEADVVLGSPLGVPGLSPRVRGSLDRPTKYSILRRSIPACAGKPASSAARIASGRVYPRVCGEAFGWQMTVSGATGLSPRVRGSHSDHRLLRAYSRSIPACAGKPVTDTPLRWRKRVYPRVCGEAQLCRRRNRHSGGLSPRVRGSLANVEGAWLQRGSIPACAGKPAGRGRDRARVRVYPRVCGEAVENLVAGDHRRGLSPRVRGSRRVPVGEHRHRGSIPACAGKPPIRRGGCQSARVYPRVCGEAPSKRTLLPSDAGLSPRVRGSLPTDSE